MQGSIPSELGDLTSVELLWIGKKEIIVIFVLYHSSLQYTIDLFFVTWIVENNTLSGTIPAEISNIEGLKYLFAGKVFIFFGDYWLLHDT